ncbi:hypothetical protein U1Q18_029398 [Sarracenia purpurea var. burkii]
MTVSTKFQRQLGVFSFIGEQKEAEKRMDKGFDLRRDSEQGQRLLVREIGGDRRKTEVEKLPELQAARQGSGSAVFGVVCGGRVWLQTLKRNCRRKRSNERTFPFDQFQTERPPERWICAGEELQ